MRALTICATFLIAALVALIGGSTASASVLPGMSYHGRIVTPSGTPLESLNVQFKIQIRTPDTGNCLLYEETRNIDMTGSGGAFAFTVNDGTGQRTDTTGLGLDQIFGNNGTLTVPAANCTSGSGSYTPGPTDPRNIAISFYDSSTMSAYENMPAQSLNYAPLAVESYQISGFKAQNLLRVQDSGVMQNTSPLTLANYIEFLALLQGTSGQYVHSGVNGVLMPTYSGTPPSPVKGDTWFNSATNQLNYWDGSSVQVVGGSSGGAINSGTIGGTTSVNTTGNITTTGTVTANSVVAHTDVLWDSDNTNTITLQTPATSVLTTNTTITLPPYSLVFPTSAGTSGQFLMTDGAGTLSWSSAFVDGGNAATATMNLGTTTTQDLNIITNNTPRMTISAAGNVGIGTTTPTTALEVEGSIFNHSEGATVYPQYLVQANSTTGNPQWIAQRRRGTTTTPLAVVDTDVINQLKSRGYNGTEDEDASEIRTSIDGINVTGSGNHPGGRIDFVTRGSTNASQFGLTQTAMTVRNSGYVGIGTTSPTTTFQVSAPATTNNVATITDSGTSGSLYNILEIANSGSGSSSVDVTNYSASASTSAQYVGRRAKGTVLAPLNVIAGNRLLTIGAAGYSTAGAWNPSSTSITFNAEETFTATANGGNIQFETTPQGTTSRNVSMIIAGSGKVGIGSTTPVTSLDMSTRTDAISLPQGATAQQPAAPAAGMFRYNNSSSPGWLEYYNGTSWQMLTNGSSSNYVPTSGGTINGNLTLSPTVGAGLTVTSGGIDNGSNGITNAGFISGVGSSITGAGAMSVAAGGTNQTLGLTSSGTGAVNLSTGNGTAVSVVDAGASTVDYITLKGSASGGAPTIGTAGSDTNISLILSPKGTGFVGVGTSSPSSKLHVASGNLTLDTSYGINFGSSTYSYVKGTSGAASTLTLGTGGSPAMTINVSGNVGIGTTSPSDLLHVAASGGNNAGISQEVVGSGTNYINQKTASTGGTIVTNGTYLGVLTSLGHDGVTYQNATTIRSEVDGSPAAGSMPGRLLFLTTPTTTTTPVERMRITSAGYVGIGTASPGGILQVNPTVQGDGIRVVGTNGPLNSVSNGTYSIDFGLATSTNFYSNMALAGDEVIRARNSGSTGNLIISDQNTNGKISFAMGTSALNDAAVMTISHAGNVGIGTTSPVTALQVNSSVAAAPPATSGTTPNGLLARFGNSPGSVVTLDVGTSSTSGVWLQGTQSTNLANNWPLLLNPNGGNVGVGVTANPTSAFDINGALTLRGMAAPAVSTGGLARIYYDSTSNQVMLSQNAGAYAPLSSGSGSSNFSSDITASGSGTGLAVTSTTASTSTTTGAETISGGLGVAGAVYAGTMNVANSTLIVTSAYAGVNGVLGTTAYSNSTYSPTSSSINVPGGANILSKNSATIDGTGVFHYFQPNNSSSLAQNAYVGAVSATGSSNYSPAIVFGQQTGSTAYAERMRIDTNGNVGVGTSSPSTLLGVGSGNFFTVDSTGQTTITTSGANALTVGQTGTTNPLFQVNSSTTGTVNGLSLSGSAAGSGVTLQTISTTNEPLNIYSKGSGIVTIGATGGGNSTSSIQLSPGGVAATVSHTAASFTPSGRSNSAAGAQFIFTAASGNSMLNGEVPDVQFNMAATQTHVGSGYALERHFLINAPSGDGLGSAGTITDDATFAVSGAPTAGTNATVTNAHGIYVGSNAVAAVNSYGLTVNAPSGATNNYAAQFLGGNVGIGTSTPATALDVAGPINMQQGYFENLGSLGTLGCGTTNLSNFNTNMYQLTACASGTTTLNIPVVSGWPSGNKSWTVTFMVTGQTASVFNVSYNGSLANVFWDRNSTGTTGGNNFSGFSVNSGSTDMIQCLVVSTGTVNAYCSVGAQY